MYTSTHVMVADYIGIKKKAMGPIVFGLFV